MSSPSTRRVEALERRLLLASVLDPIFGDDGILDLSPFIGVLAAYAPTPDGAITGFVRSSTPVDDGDPAPTTSYELKRYVDGKFTSHPITDENFASDRAIV